ncbi:uncharacterized protein BCR38DRAFT_112972 [Pseudomassariella vexata]|uniref:Rhodopsin domain-containing protein n=1 Tax=Pseudomassariella vexata TaxID=1141098 RepID=A0A1Y2DCU4_9PEZI|nr:uncharacterized protein BCR38DRAFT_112972 [Pseudomassariella vexata]ORY56946.1 hypothetical protein BCR38DRAFT_112972 [Pseudomassariella vexata]
MLDTHQIHSITVSLVLTAVTLVFVGLRIWARLVAPSSFGFNDVLIMASWLFSLTLCCSLVAATHFGLGLHRNQVSDEDYEIFLRVPIGSSVLYSWGIATAKMSIAVLYLKFMPEHRLRRFNQGLIAFILIQAMMETCVTVFRCNPIYKAWEPEVGGYCLDQPTLWYTVFGLNLAVNLVLLVEPVPIMWHLQLPRAEWIGLIIMISLGLL